MNPESGIQNPPAMIPHFPPVWAEVFGEDDFGIFAECSVKDVRFVWRWIMPGRFQMGCDPQDKHGFGDEKPQHEVMMSRGFWLGETPVTQAQWQAVMGTNPSQFKGDKRPVESVTWHQCQDFAAQLNEHCPGLHAALPWESQWEYACRAGTQSAFNDGSACTEPVGDDLALRELGWFDKNSEGETQDARRKKPNAWGLYDMHGNVWEWCADAWDEKAYAKRADGAVDPRVDLADERAFRVVRGGSWDARARGCRSACRDGDDPGDDWHSRGLRLAAGQNGLQAAEPQ